jgi:hypothetical protein
MLYASRVIGERKIEQRMKLNHHVADSGGRAFWCSCFRGMRVSGKPRYGLNCRGPYVRNKLYSFRRFTSNP